MPYATTDGAKGKRAANVFDYAVGTGIAIGDGGVPHGDDNNNVDIWFVRMVGGVGWDS